MALHRALPTTILSIACAALLASPIAADARGGPNDDTGHIPITVCHATASPTNPYVEIVVDDDGTYGGHGDHAGDLLGVAPGTCPTGDGDGESDTSDPIDDVNETLPEDQDDGSTGEEEQSDEEDSADEQDGDETTEDEDSTNPDEESTDETDPSDNEESNDDETDEAIGDENDGSDQGEDDQNEETPGEDSVDDDQDGTDITEDDTDDSDTDETDDSEEPSDGNPIANDDAATVQENSSVLVTVLANDSASDPAGVLEVTMVGGPGNGTAELIVEGVDAGKIRYTPNTGYVGMDVFPYTIADDTGDSASALVTITVTPLDSTDETETDGTDEAVDDDTDAEETEESGTDETSTDESDDTSSVDEEITTLPNAGAGQFESPTALSGMLLLMAIMIAALGAWVRRVPLAGEEVR